MRAETLKKNWTKKKKNDRTENEATEMENIWNETNLNDEIVSKRSCMLDVLCLGFSSTFSFFFFRSIYRIVITFPFISPIRMSFFSLSLLSLT